MQVKKILRRGIKILLMGLVAVALFVFVCNYYITSVTAGYSFDQIEQIPANEVGIILGTSKYTSLGHRNDYFYARIEAAVKLFESGKIKTIVVSGDNQYESYNEPREMRRALIKRGIPADRIVFDFAGLRTLDSVIRAMKVFKLKSFTIISQKFQNERALFIALHNDADAIAFNAQGQADLKMIVREYISRVKCVLDVMVFDTKPRHLGKPLDIPKVEDDDFDDLSDPRSPSIHNN